MGCHWEQNLQKPFNFWVFFRVLEIYSKLLNGFYNQIHKTNEKIIHYEIKELYVNFEKINHITRPIASTTIKFQKYSLKSWILVSFRNVVYTNLNSEWLRKKSEMVRAHVWLGQFCRHLLISGLLVIGH